MRKMPARMEKFNDALRLIVNEPQGIIVHLEVNRLIIDHRVHRIQYLNYFVLPIFGQNLHNAYQLHETDLTVSLATSWLNSLILRRSMHYY